MRFIVTIATAIIALAPMSAHAGDTACLWRSLPQSARAAAQAAYVANSNVGDAIPDAAVADAVNKCVPRPANTKRAVVDSGGMALVAYASQVGSETALKTALHIEPAKLDQAWALVEPKTRKSWGDEFLSGARPSERMMSSIAQASVAAYPGLSAAQLRKSPEFEHFFMYFGGRAMREQLEARF